MIRRIKGNTPQVGEGCYIDEAACVIGDVALGPETSVWPGAVLRGDQQSIVVGGETSLQDNCVLHTNDNDKLSIGSRVTVGHGAILHSCTIEDECLIGMSAVILDAAVIGKHSIVGAGALVTGGTQIPPGSMVLGSPAKVVRQVKPEEVESILFLAEKYKKHAQTYRIETAE